ncbi:MAG: HAMP domain-containing sensor histidine kinase [Candidatus Moranbacteria bacterium]|nr:HAMP domain-containing sensor histidine kinase [Candidatus Moranbacteria bacterium]
MKKIFQSGLAFVRENPRILYSLVLLVFVPGAFFFNTYSIISGIEKDIDRITQRKAVLAEKIISEVLADKLEDQEQLQGAVNRITSNNAEILSLAILYPESDFSRFRVVASSEQETLSETTDNIQYTLAWNKPEGIAFLDRDETGRFWRVTKLLSDGSGVKVGLITTTFSLQDSDALIERTVNRSYLVLMITVMVVLLLVSNQARLFGYVLTLNKLKEVDAMKDNLVSMASHELRSPLTAIKGYLELLEDKKLVLDEDAKKYFTNISLSVNRLNTLVQDMLEVSRLEGNRVPLTMTDFDPAALITQSVEELRSQAIQKGLALNLLPLGTVMVHADEDRVQEILVNLVGNAIKYTLKGSVSISATTKGTEYLVTVADTGFGISAADQKKLFQKFSRIQNEQTQTITGTGLGLWITFELAQRMGGTIMVESIEGVGSHFTLHLPLTKK